MNFYKKIYKACLELADFNEDLAVEFYLQVLDQRGL